MPVTFTVIQGGGKLFLSTLNSQPSTQDGSASVTVLSTRTGHAEVLLQLGPDAGQNIVEANYPGNPNLPATFIAYGVARDPSKPTTLTGLLLDNTSCPIGGATCSVSVGGRMFTTTTDTQGRFVFAPSTLNSNELSTLPSGPAQLFVNGSTATNLLGATIPTNSFPSLEFSLILIPNAENSLPMPVLLPRLNLNNQRLYYGTNDLVLTCEGMEGLKMTIKAGSMRKPDGTLVTPDNPSFVSLNQVHHDSVPMPIPDGASPPFAWTLQPGGATFDPPVQVEYPNMSGLPAGTVAYFLSYNHDTRRFEIIASGHVREDSATIVTDPGAGLTIAGWGCNCPPYSVSGKCNNGFKITKLQLKDIDNTALQYLSADDHTYFSGNTRIHGTITVVGTEDDTIASLILEVVQNGQTVATAHLSSSAQQSLINQTFGTDEKVEISTSQLLFELPSSEASKVNGSADGILTLRAKAVSGKAKDAKREFGPVQILVRYEGNNRYGTRDVQRGGDDWVKPSVRRVVQHFSDILVNDFSNMNGGSFAPDHQGHQNGQEVDGWFDGFNNRDAQTAQRMIGYLNDATYGSRIVTVFVTYQRIDTDPFWVAIRDLILDDDRMARDVIRVEAAHDTHFHWNIAPAAVTPSPLPFGLAEAQSPLNDELDIELDETWVVTVGGQTVQVNSDSNFTVPNIAAPDQFGPGGPGTAPDFVSDDYVRLTGQSTVEGTNLYVFSEFFQLRQGQTISITFTDIPPRKPESLTIVCTNRILRVGEPRLLEVPARFADGSTLDVASRARYSSYRISNPSIATVSADGLVTPLKPGVIYVTAVNEGASAVCGLNVVAGLDGLTTVTGTVVDTNGVPVVGAIVRFLDLAIAPVTTGLDGRFTIADVPTTLGQLGISVRAVVNGVGLRAFLRINGVAGGSTILGSITVAVLDTAGATFAAGYYHTVALREDGTLWAWGANGSGELGNGTLTSAKTPQPILTNQTWQVVAAGYFHTVALREDGTLWAWGVNSSGQLGNGTLTSTNTPQPILTNQTWQAVATGRSHTVALRADGTLWAWGDNDYGQIAQPVPWLPYPVLGGAGWGAPRP